MANVKISQLPAASAAVGANEYEINEAGTSKKVTGTQLAAFVEGVVSSAPTFTGIVSFADGSNSAPSITNTGDVNTGMFFGAADTVSFTAGGTKRLDVNTSGIAVTGTATIADSGLVLGSTAVTSTAAELNQLDGKVAKTAGKESIWVPASAMYPSTTNGCSDIAQVETTALRPDLKVLDFAAAADDFAQFAIAFPKSWNEGTVTYQPFWTVTGTNTGTMVWQLGGIAVSSDDTINTAFGTLVATTALAHSGTSNDLMVSAESGAVTIAGSPAANDLCFFQINNDASASGQTGAARLLGVKFFFTTDAANDA